MALTRIEIENFRCIENAEVELDPEANYFFGANGAGKTSLLEAAFFLGRGRSFRTPRLERLIRVGTHAFCVVGHVESGGRGTVLGVRGTPQGTEVRVGGEPAPGLVALAERLAIQVIDPDVHKLVEEGPARRRQFLDWGVFHVKHDFLLAWRRYRRALKQRNAALRQGRPPREVATWDTELLESAGRVTERRKEYIDELAAPVAEMAGELLGLQAHIQYQPGWPAGQALSEALAAGVARDREHGRTHSGPHRADVTIRVDGRLARDRVSRGQQKLLSAALILAQLELLRARTGRPGVLLLDDPAAELDPGSLERMMSRVSTMRIQRLVTGLSKRAPQPGAAPRSFSIEQGRVSEMV